MWQYEQSWTSTKLVWILLLTCFCFHKKISTNTCDNSRPFKVWQKTGCGGEKEQKVRFLLSFTANVDYYIEIWLPKVPISSPGWLNFSRVLGDVILRFRANNSRVCFLKAKDWWFVSLNVQLRCCHMMTMNNIKLKSWLWFSHAVATALIIIEGNVKIQVQKNQMLKMWN